MTWFYHSSNHWAYFSGIPYKIGAFLSKLWISLDQAMSYNLGNSLLNILSINGIKLNIYENKLVKNDREFLNLVLGNFVCEQAFHVNHVSMYENFVMLFWADIDKSDFVNLWGFPCSFLLERDCQISHSLFLATSL